MSSMLNSVAVKDVGTALTVIYTAPAGKTAVAIGANVANKLDQTIYVDIIFRKNNVDYYLLKECFIPRGAAYIWSGSEQKICLDEGDSFVIKSSLADSCDVIVSVSEIA